MITCWNCNLWNTLYKILNFAWFKFLVTTRKSKFSHSFAFVVCVIFLSSSARLCSFRFANKICEFRSVMGEKRSEREKYDFLILDCKILLFLRVAQILWEFWGIRRKTLRSSWTWTAYIRELNTLSWKSVMEHEVCGSENQNNLFIT